MIHTQKKVKEKGEWKENVARSTSKRRRWRPLTNFRFNVQSSDQEVSVASINKVEEDGVAYVVRKKDFRGSHHKKAFGARSQSSLKSRIRRSKVVRKQNRMSNREQDESKMWLIELKKTCGRLRDLKVCFESIPKRNVYHYTYLMSIFSRRKMSGRVEKLFERMIEEEISPDVYTFNTLINAYGTDHKQAEGVLKRMKKNKIRPNVTTFNTLMNAYGTDHKQAEEVLERMKKNKIRPDVTTFTTLMNAYGTDHKQAEEVLERMKKNKIQPDVITFTTLIDASRNNSSKAHEIFKKMLDNGLKPNRLSLCG